ncbi:MAG: DUF1294 domain-containing protein [Planctomicrobium sp.]|jgi:uncharacterized membrane protein YsdA (DUF1294 family)/cold shock CspA family protein|nr:DUF1294 domain-containing protein [Planctomicrobium sp.]
MRKQGKIVRWNDEKGFGFIVPNAGGEDVFLHISAFQSTHRRPVDNESVTYVVATDSDGRLRAEDVLYQGESRHRKKGERSKVFRLVLPALFFIMLILLTSIDRLSGIVLIIYTAMSLISFMAYTVDKSASENNRWRTREKTLHLLDFCCGWPGGLVAQNLLRHKTSKVSFQVTTWFMVIFNCLTLMAIILPQGDELIQSAQQKLEATLDSIPAPERNEERQEQYDDKNHGMKINPQ